MNLRLITFCLLLATLTAFAQTKPSAVKPKTKATPTPAPTPGPVAAADTKASDKEKAAQAAAEVWLALVDAGQYAKSWQQAAAFFKEAVTESDWIAAIKLNRQPLGAFKSRKVKYTQVTDRLQGAPVGQYVLLQTEAAFANKESAKEVISLALEKDGKWRIVGYFLP